MRNREHFAAWIRALRAACWGAYRDRRGQDMIEYALMAAVVAVASAAVLPNANASISTVFSKVNSVLMAAGS